MFVQNINPDLITIGPLSIRFYGIVYALGFLLVAYILSKKSNKIKNLDKDKAFDIVIYGMFFGLIGARIFHVISDFHLYQNNLLGVFAIWNGGLGFQGGLIGALIAVYFYCKKHSINMFKVLDTVVVPLPLILAFGRIANFINSEHLGFVTNVPWCVIFQKVDNLCRHPAQLYQALSQLFLFIVLVFLSKRKWSKKTGTLTWSFITGYGFIRLVTDFFRSDLTKLFLGLSHTQIINLIMIVIGVYYLYRINQSSKK